MIGLMISSGLEVGIDFTRNRIRREIVQRKADETRHIKLYTASFNPIIITPGQEERLTLPNIRFGKSTGT